MQEEEKWDTTSWHLTERDTESNAGKLEGLAPRIVVLPDSPRKVQKETEMHKCKQVWGFKPCYLDMIH